MNHPTHNAGDTVFLWRGEWSMRVAPYTIEKVTAKGYTLVGGQRVNAEFRNRSANIHGLASDAQIAEFTRSAKARAVISRLNSTAHRVVKMTTEQLDAIDALLARMEGV